MLRFAYAQSRTRRPTADNCAGLSLVEIVMATTILAMVSLAVIEGMASTAEFAVSSEREDDMAKEAQAILALIGEDLSRSGWEFPAFDSADYQTDDAAIDRQLLYYPYLLQQSPAYRAASDDFDTSIAGGPLAEGLPADVLSHSDPTLPAEAGLRHFRRDASLVLLENMPLALTGEPEDGFRYFHGDTSFASDGARERSYRDSFYARSQEIVFLRSQVEAGWAPDPHAEQFPVFAFDGTSDQWQTLSVEEAERQLMTYYNDYLATVSGISPEEAMARAHRDLLDNDYRHDELGILRMSEFDLNGDLIYEDGLEVVEPKPRYRSTAPAGKQYVDNIMIPGAWLALDNDNQVSVNIRWESNVDPAQVRVTEDTAGGTPTERIEVQQLREYTYAVVPSPIGAGRLVRAFSVDLDDGDGDGVTDTLLQSRPVGVRVGELLSRDPLSNRAVVVDRVLSDKVVRVLFDTYRTDPDGTLGLNEVRVRLFMLAMTPNDPTRRIPLMQERTFTMRTGNNTRMNQQNWEILEGYQVKFPY